VEKKSALEREGTGPSLVESEEKGGGKKREDE